MTVACFCNGALKGSDDGKLLQAQQQCKWLQHRLAVLPLPDGV